MLISNFVDELPDTIKIVVDGIEQPLYGKIRWRNRRMAGVRFEWPLQGRPLQEAAERLDPDAYHWID